MHCQVHPTRVPLARAPAMIRLREMDAQSRSSQSSGPRKKLLKAKYKQATFAARGTATAPEIAKLQLNTSTQAKQRPAPRGQCSALPAATQTEMQCSRALTVIDHR
ncbi:hypothetical protein EIP86_005453 [Pleurotus ostreatoroseus]|nr:hypothetical protein EIP86_005453 [Pleurotus ostreatoroseus]